MIAPARLEKEWLKSRHYCLVIYVCRPFIGLGFDFKDLISEGILGLLVAANEYDPSHDCTFETFATLIIHRYVVEYMRTAGVFIRYPSNYYRNGRTDAMSAAIYRGRHPDSIEPFHWTYFPCERVSEMQRQANKAKASLSALEREIVDLSFGFRGKEWTLEEIGERFSLSGASICRMRKRAIGKMYAAL